MDCMIAQHYKPSSAANYFRPDATGRGGGHDICGKVGEMKRVIIIYKMGKR